jgi:hypothetical protein
MGGNWLYEYEAWVWGGVVFLVMVIMLIATWLDARESDKFRKKVNVCRWTLGGGILTCDCIYCTQKHGYPARYNRDIDYEWCPYCGRLIVREAK